jgi:hypothetical protein
MFDRLLVSLAKSRRRASIYPFGHSVEVDEEAQENFISCRTVFVNSAEIAEDRDAGHVFAVEGQDTGGLLAQALGAFWWWDLAVVCCCDLGQQTSDHLNYV